MANKDIIQELSDLGSDLARSVPQNPYLVPKEYFEGFAGRVLSLVKADEYLSSLPKDTPYQVPVGYFEEFEERMMEVIRNHADYQTSKEELESISSLLSSLNKRPVYSVPQGYFENFKVTVEEKKREAKVVSIAGRKWFRYASAAIVTGVIAMAGLMYFKQPKVDPLKQPQVWVEKNLNKVSTEEINDFVKLAEQESQAKENIALNKPDDLKDLMKDVSTKEIDKFLNETGDVVDETLLN
jgi:hypothetical protein